MCQRSHLEGKVTLFCVAMSVNKLGMLFVTIRHRSVVQFWITFFIIRCHRQSKEMDNFGGNHIV